MSAKFGGFNGTEGTVTLKVGDSTIGTGSLNATSDVTVNSTSTATGKVLTVTVTDISKGVKCYNISYTYSPSDPSDTRTATTVTIDATDITNTNVFSGTAAGSLAATVKAGETVVDGAVIAWSGDNDAVATINASTGAVTLVAAGEVTFTATYAGDETNYKGSSAQYKLTVTNDDPNAPGTENNPYSVAQAIAAIDAANKGTIENVYVEGTVSQVDSHNSNYMSITYWISDDGTTTDQFEVYSGKGIDGADFSSVDDIQVGDVVVIKGNITYYAKNSVYEFAANNQLVSHIGSPKLSVNPGTADPFTYEEGGDVADEQLFKVIGTNLTSDVITVSVTGEFDLRGPSSVYGNSSLTLASGDEFGVNINDNLTEGNYEGTLTIASEGATTITIALTGTVTGYVAPSITAAETTVNVGAAEGEGTINMTYTKIDTDLVDVEFYESDGTTTTTYDWIDAEIDSEKNLYYTVSANTGEARTAYLKVYGVDNNGGDDLIYSELITITQAAYVPVVEYALFTGDLIEGDYVIYYKSDSGGKAMTNSVFSDAKRLKYTEVTPTDDIIATNKAGIVWHIAQSGDYWTIYNAAANAYAASNGTKNQAQMLADGTNDMALWTVTKKEEGTYEFVNKKNAADEINSNLRNNGTYGFACYSTSTGGALSLYKKVEQNVTITAAGYATYCSTSALDFSAVEGLTAYKATVADKKVSFTEVGLVPAGEGVLLKGAEGTYAIPVIASAAAITNDFIGVTEETVVNEKGIFVLMNGEKGVGFYQTKNTFTVGANTAYLPAIEGARTFIALDEATAIDGIAAEKVGNGEIYNLQGQRVVKAQKGLYIVNGKKVVMK